MPVAKVEPLVTARALKGPFDYRLPERLGEVGVGSILRVPFGPRRILGVVVEIAETSSLPPQRLAEPIEALDAGATAELVRLAGWVAHEYCSTPARALGLVVPPGTGSGAGEPRAAVERHAVITDAGIAALADGPRLGAKQRLALERLRDAAASLPSGGLGVGAGTIRSLEARGLVELRAVERRRRPESAPVGARHDPVSLTEAQRQAVRSAIEAIDGAGPRELLLHGVTGSGKTEVYLAAAAAALERGKSAVVLVPEIGLTPQALHRFRSRLGERVAVLHSGLSPGERFDEWRRLRSGEATVCVGPRSAVFAPVEGLGLLVVDEEHDSSYKQESDPRYDAREVARRRAEMNGAALVFGTATPRPESWAGMARITLAERVDGQALPPVEILDMRAPDAAASPLHPRTREELARIGAEGGKAIVMVNRRGWQVHLSCRGCGHVWRCPSCDVSLVSHRDSGALRCHHCGHAEPVPGRCSQCGSVAIAHHGAGSERVEELVREAVGDVPVGRLDTDTAGRGRHAEILRRFGAAPRGVLVGTQMVGKGHDFPDVTLAVIVDADATLRFPDFRAEERAFALVAQLAGRSGRSAKGGRVLCQTLAPEASAIVHAASHDAAGFLGEELERRRALRYPPFATLVRIELTSPDLQRSEEAAAWAAAALEPSLPAGTQLLGPAPRFRLRGRHRRQLLLKGPERGQLVDAVREVVNATAARRLRDVAISVDVDPH